MIVISTCSSPISSIHLLTGYEGNSTCIVPSVPIIVLCIASGNSWYLGDNTSAITRISSLY